jgi:bifunctional DNA primase/polymerase-like protein/uncharacterized protein DUF5906/CHC2-type zinc finger protein
MMRDTNHEEQNSQTNHHSDEETIRSSESKKPLRPVSLLLTALQYAKQGWAVLPLHSAANGKCSCHKESCRTPGKHPRTINGVNDATKEESTIREWWTQWPDANIGLATGKVSGRVVLDIDVKKGKQGDVSLQNLVKQHQALPETLQAQTPTGGYHFVFKAPAVPMGSPNGVRPGIDILTDGRYFVAAPSMINEQPYQWIVNKPEALCPHWIIDLANEGRSAQVPSQADVAMVVKDLLPEGKERNGEWFVCCPFHEEQNPSFSVNLQEGMYHCFACGAKGDLASLYAHIKGVTPASARVALGQTPACIEELNQKHAVVSVGGKGVILTETHDPSLQRKDIALSSPTDLKLLYMNRKERVAGRRKAIVDLWLAHPDRRQYESIVFAPNRDVPGYYNFWQGFAVEPKAKKGGCSLYLAHLKDNIAQGNQKIYDYVLGWMAHMIQRPDQRLGVSLVLRGKQGTGKGEMAKQLGHLLGRHFVHIQQHKHLLGNFNAHLKDALLVFADEAFWAGDKASEGALKAMVTEEQLPIEFKGKDVVYVKNHIHLIVASNHDWVVPAGLEERRFCILDVGEDRMQDGPYFEAIQKQMQQGGSEALLYLLQHHDLKGKNLRTFPQTEALLENKFLSMTPVQKFWHQRLVWGSLTENESKWEPWILRTRLHDEYRDYIGDLGQSRKSTETELGMGLKKLVPGLRVTERTVNKKRVPVWEFPDLAICREAFEKALNYPYSWDTDSQDSSGAGPAGP